MTFLRAEDLLAAYCETGTVHVEILQRIEASKRAVGYCALPLAEVVAFLRQVTAPPAGAASIDAVNFVHWLVSDQGCRLDVPLRSEPPAAHDGARVIKPSMSEARSA